MKDIYSILKGVYENIELRRTIVPLFIGNPGVSKSVQIRAFAKEMGVKLVPFITSQRNPFEISGLAMPDRDTKRMSFWDFDTLLDMKDGDILFFDEVFNGNPTVLNACLTILEEREMISGKKLPDIMIVAAANPQGMTPITPQIKERFVWYNVNFDRKMWQGYMFNKYKMPSKISSKLCDLITGESFKNNNFYTPRSLDKATAMVIDGIPSPYSKIIEPILDSIIENKLSEKIKITEDSVMEVGESMSWLKLIRINRNIEISEVDKSITVEHISNYEILMFNDKDEIIGEIKNIEVLKNMYWFSNEDIIKIESGIKTPTPSCYPLLPSTIFRHFFLQKT